MKINFEKSRMFCSTNIDNSLQQELSTILGITRASNLGKYLGLPILKGRVTRENFAPIIEKVKTRLASWKNKLLNKAGKLCLAKSVISSLPVYGMQALWLPDSICDYIDKSLRRCIWAKGENTRSWNLVPWAEIVCPKADGGLRIRSTRNNNVALLGKMLEDLLNAENKFW